MKLDEWLRSLGETSGDVADSLRKMGVKGKRRDEQRCPIAMAIAKAIADGTIGPYEAPADRCIVITTFRVACVFSGPASISDEPKELALVPGPVAAFIQDVDVFDMWSELIT